MINEPKIKCPLRSIRLYLTIFVTMLTVAVPYLFYYRADICISRPSSLVRQETLQTGIQSMVTNHNIMDYTAVGNVDTQRLKAVYDEIILFNATQRYHRSFYVNKAGDQCIPRFPKCIIIGVMKSGTRELIDFMAIHPNIVIKTKPYELHYFWKSTKSLEWYKSQMPCSYSDQITVTKSPFYFTYGNVPERLYRYNKTLKMILLVREPIQRLLSALSFRFFHKHSSQINQDLSKMPAVDDQIVDNATGRVKIEHDQIKLSTYDIAMKRYLQYFSRDQILIIETKDFKGNPAKVLNQVETFLGLEHFISEDMFVYNHEKKHYCIKLEGNNMACYGTNRGRTSQKPLRPNTLETIGKYFYQHNEAFFELINARFDWQ